MRIHGAPERFEACATFAMRRLPGLRNSKQLVAACLCLWFLGLKQPGRRCAGACGCSRPPLVFAEFQTGARLAAGKGSDRGEMDGVARWSDLPRRPEHPNTVRSTAGAARLRAQGGGKPTSRRPSDRPTARVGAPRPTPRTAIWLILPVVICLSQRLSHACLSMSCSYCETANGSLNQL